MKPNMTEIEQKMGLAAGRYESDEDVYRNSLHFKVKNHGGVRKNAFISFRILQAVVDSGAMESLVLCLEEPVTWQVFRGEGCLATSFLCLCNFFPCGPTFPHKTGQPAAQKIRTAHHSHARLSDRSSTLQ